MARSTSQRNACGEVCCTYINCLLSACRMEATTSRMMIVAVEVHLRWFQARCEVKMMLGNGPPWPSCGQRCCLRECHLRVSRPLAPLSIETATQACSPQCYCRRCWTIIHALHDTRHRSTEDEAAEQRRRAEHAARDSSLSSRLCDIRQRSTEANGVTEGGIVTH